MLNFSKKLIYISALSLFMISLSFAKEGTTCILLEDFYRAGSTPVYRCSKISKEKLTVDEIYSKGYEVVATQSLYETAILIVEKQD